MMGASVDAAIVGGGAAGTALLVSLAEQAPAGFRAVVFDPADVGPGTAYAPQSASLLLNGPVRAMSVHSRDTQHFERWLVDEPGDALICRARYGAYARATAAAALAARNDFSHVRDNVIDIVRCQDESFAVTTASGNAVQARAVVLALGNFAPADSFLPQPLREFSGYFGDPWHVDTSAFQNGDVVLIGSRLTAMDVVALLDERAFRGRVHLVSRHGLLPLVEDPRVRGADPALLALDASTPHALLQSMRRAARAFEGDWREVVDAIRADTPSIWASWSIRDRKRFLRHAQSMWAIHRYRVPAATYAAFARLNAEGRIVNHRGKIRAVEAHGQTVTMTVGGAGAEERIRAAYVINCTGPNSDVRTVTQPLVRSALERGMIRPDELHLGVDADVRCRILDASGQAQSNLYGIGAMLRGLWYETTAVPEITKHAAAIASRLLQPEEMLAAG